MKLIKNNHSVWGDSVKISPILIPNKEIPRQVDGNVYFVSYTEQEILDIYNEWVKDSTIQIASNMILENDLLGIPKGSWIAVDGSNEGFSIEL